VVIFRHMAIYLLSLTCLQSMGFARTVASTPPHLNLVLSASAPDDAVRKQRQQVQGKAFWQSFLVPGLGQIATGRERIGYAFLSAEVGLVGSLIGLRVYAGRLEDDYRFFAAQHAGAPDGNDHQYYVDIGNWMEVQSYNEARLRGRSFDALYTDPDDAWSWDSDQNRVRFKKMRLDSDRARGTALMVVGGLVINHLFSAIEAASGASHSTQITVHPVTGGGAVLSCRWIVPDRKRL
jgi:hypothetical protein